MPRGEQENTNIDSAAFEDQFNKYEMDLFRYTRYLADSIHAAEDIYQETWLRVARHLNSGKQIRNFKNFLFTVAANVYKDELKKVKVRRFFLGPSLDDEEQNIWVSNDDGQNEFLSDELEKSLNQLSARQRSMFCLCHIEGFKISEISEIMKCAEGTVKTTIFKAVQKLRQDLKQFRE